MPISWHSQKQTSQNYCEASWQAALEVEKEIYGAVCPKVGAILVLMHPLEQPRVWLG